MLNHVIAKSQQTDTATNSFSTGWFADKPTHRLVNSPICL